MKALLLAAGEGTRLRPLTNDRPKPMLPVGGRPLLEHLVVLLRRHGVRETAINLHYRPMVIVEHFADGSQFGVDITYSYERTLLGSAGAARALETFFGNEDFLVIYGDVLTNVDLGELVAAHRRGGALATIVVHEAEDPSRVGIVNVDSSSRVIGFVEKPAPGAECGTLANAGVYVVSPTVLDLVPPARAYDFGHDLFPRLLQLGLPIQAFRSSSYILDIGSPARYAQAERDLQAGRYTIASDLKPELVLSTLRGYARC